jgi:hypothetical protein
MKIDYTNKHGMMVGYVDNGTVTAVVPGWDISPEALSKLLLQVVDSPLLVPVFKKDDYCGVEGFGDVIESNLSWNKEDMRKDVGHLFCHMTGIWKYSDNGIDWTPAIEEFVDTSGTAFTNIREALEMEKA